MAVVTKAVAVSVLPLGPVEWEHVDLVEYSVVVVVCVDGIASAVAVVVGRHHGGDQGIALAAAAEAQHLEVVGPVVAVIVVVGVVADAVVVGVLGLRWVELECIVDVEHHVVVVVVVDDVADPVAVEVRGERVGIHRVGAAVRLLEVGPAVAVVVLVGVVADAIEVEVGPLSGVEREHVLDVVNAVAVVVIVHRVVAEVVVIEVVGCAECGEGVGLAVALVDVRPAVVVVVGVGVVA